MTDRASSPSVLVVDDDPLELFFLERHLGAAGYEVVTADGGAPALELLRAMPFSLVVTDWLMPGMEGPDLCRAVRTRRELDHVHLIMLTAHAEKARLIEAFDAGADDFLTKPCDPGELLARMRCGMRHVRLKAELAAREREVAELRSQLPSVPPELRRAS